MRDIDYRHLDKYDRPDRSKRSIHRKSQPLKDYGVHRVPPPPMPQAGPPPPRKRKRRKTIKLYKDEAAVERGRRGAETRKANAPKRAAQSEHERRSQAAKKGWDKIGARERTERALKGWDTRDRKRGVRPEHRANQQLMDEQIRHENRRRKVPSNPLGRFPRGDVFSGPRPF